MKTTRHSVRLTAAFAVAMMVAACGGKQKAASADSSMSQDLQMAGSTAATQPALGDTATATAATTPAPAASPSTAAPKSRAAAPPPARRPAPTAQPKAAPTRPSGQIAEGASLVLNPTTRVCTDSNKVGDMVTATVAEPVTGTNGVAVPAGAVVHLKITALKGGANLKDPIDMGFEPVSVEFGGHSYALSATVTEEKIDHIRNESTSKDVEKVVGGAVVGAIAGKLIGKTTKGAVVGAAAGAAAGAGVAAATANYKGCIAQGSRMAVKLTAPLVIQ